MGVNHTFGKFLYLDTALTQRQPAHTRPRQFAFRAGERKLKFTSAPRLVIAVFNVKQTEIEE